MIALVALLVAAAGCGADRQGYCTGKALTHDIAYGEATRLKINTALGDVVSIEFPEGVRMKGAPALGNAAIFKYQAQETEPLRVLVWPRMPRGGNLTTEDLLGQRGNLQIFMDSGATLLVDLRVARSRESVQRVVLAFPERVREREFVKEQLAEQARRLTAAFEEEKAALSNTVVEQSRRRMARAMLDRMHCESLRERAMHDLLVVRVHRICRIGAETFVAFEVHNRRRDLFHLKDVVLREASDDEGNVEALVEWRGDPTLAFDERVFGMAIFGIEGDAARAYALTVIEDGGAKREVVVDGIAF
ncbi:MAG: hypothetical protein RMA76_09245 [Deltaproteobacteria bacterium]|jgi:hypothetical protein